MMIYSNDRSKAALSISRSSVIDLCIENAKKEVSQVVVRWGSCLMWNSTTPDSKSHAQNYFWPLILGE
jgi:hypothetical protein